MSLSRQSTTDSCKYCDSRLTDYFSPGYCSKLCYHKHKGTKLFNTVAHDHTQCANCGRTLKEIEEPTDEQLRQIDGFYSKKAVCGYQYRTPNAETGEISLDFDAGEYITTGTICGECGNTGLHTEFPESQNRHLMEYGARIFSAIEDKKDEHNTDLDRDVFFDMLHTTDDLIFALGKAAHSAH